MSESGIQENEKVDNVYQDGHPPTSGSQPEIGPDALFGFRIFNNLFSNYNIITWYKMELSLPNMFFLLF